MKPGRTVRLLYEFFLSKQTADGLRRRRTLGKPVLSALAVNFQLHWRDDWIVLAEDFQKPAIPSPSLVDNDNPIIRTFLRPDPGQTHCYQKVASLLIVKPLNSMGNGTAYTRGMWAEFRNWTKLILNPEILKAQI